MPGQKNRIILDSNIWISFLITNQFSNLDSLIFSNDVILLYSYDLIDEFIEVTNRPKFKKYFRVEAIEGVLDYIKNIGILVDIITKVYACRDQKDNFLLSLVIDGKATHLITGDKDLLVLKEFGGTKILPIADYLAEKGN